MEKYAVIIVGAGASGIMCALQSKQKTLLLEANDRVGKKILVTGNGKCNISNDVLDVRNYNTPLVAQYFQQFNNQQTLKYFESLGIFTYADEAGRRYPLSNSAHTVLDLMLKALNEKSEVKTVVNAQPLKISRVADGFTVTTANQTYFCQKLVIATGGNSGTRYFDDLHVRYHAFRPSLVGLKTTKNKGLAGVRVSHVRVRMNEFDEVGEILFKEDGISGIVIFNLSAYLARHGIKTGQVRIDLLADITADQLFSMLQTSVSEHPHYFLTELLSGFLHKSLARNILERLDWSQKIAKDTSVNEIQILVQSMKNMSLTMMGFADNQQVYTGGVDLTDLDEHLQHKRIPHLYCIGEVVNIDGVCGGYNLQWAWTSGKIVGDNL